MTTSHATSAFRSHWPWAALVTVLITVFAGAVRIGEIVAIQQAHDISLRNIQSSQKQLVKADQNIDHRLDQLIGILKGKNEIPESGN